MIRKLFILVSLFLLCSCSSGINLYTSDEKNNHYRTFARITDAEETEQTYFEIKKRTRQVMAETEIYRSKTANICVAGGKHKDKDWSTGLILRWNY